MKQHLAALKKQTAHLIADFISTLLCIGFGVWLLAQNFKFAPAQ